MHIYQIHPLKHTHYWSCGDGHNCQTLKVHRWTLQLSRSRRAVMYSQWLYLITIWLITPPGMLPMSYDTWNFTIDITVSQSWTPLICDGWCWQPIPDCADRDWRLIWIRGGAFGLKTRNETAPLLCARLPWTPVVMVTRVLWAVFLSRASQKTYPTMHLL